MALSKRHLIMAATATTLGIGGVLASGATANAATTADQTVAVTAPASQTTTTTEASSTQPAECYAYLDEEGNWVWNLDCFDLDHYL